jgi:hypothetical protein
MTPSENNKRIAKNTLFLYFRSILTLGVGLYTSREVLAQLGVEDFGFGGDNWALVFEHAANFVYQFTIFTACVGILQMRCLSWWLLDG